MFGLRERPDHSPGKNDVTGGSCAAILQEWRRLEQRPGDVNREGDNFYGGAVDIAALISAESEAGEVLVSDTVRGLAGTAAALAFEDLGE